MLNCIIMLIIMLHNHVINHGGFKHRAQHVFIVKDHRRRQVAGSRGRQKVIHRRRQVAWVQGQAEGHIQGVQKGNSTGREKASNVVREIRLQKPF